MKTLSYGLHPWAALLASGTCAFAALAVGASTGRASLASGGECVVAGTQVRFTDSAPFTVPGGKVFLLKLLALRGDVGTPASPIAVHVQVEGRPVLSVQLPEAVFEFDHGVPFHAGETIEIVPDSIFGPTHALAAGIFVDR
jgi:hypothetical protein